MTASQSSVLSINATGNRMISFRNWKCFVLATVFLLFCIEAKSQIKRSYMNEYVNKDARRIALIIGVDQYEDDKIAPQQVSGNLEQLNKLLINKYGYQNVYSLFNEKATSRNIYGKLDEILKEMGPDDAFFIYIAAHFILQKQDDDKYDQQRTKLTIKQSIPADNRVYFVPFDALIDKPYTLIDLNEIFNLIFRMPANRIFLGINDCIDIPDSYENHFYDASLHNKVIGSCLFSYSCHSALKTNMADTISSLFNTVLNDPATKGAYSFTSDLVEDMMSKKLGGMGVEVVATKCNEGYIFNLPRSNIDQAIVNNLKENNPVSTRLQAIDDLVKFVNGASVNAKPKITEEAMVNYLIPILMSTVEIPEVQIKVIDVLPKLEYNQSLVYLEKVLLQNKNYNVQEAAFNTIRKYPPDQSIQYIRHALEFDEPKIRISSIKALASIPDTASLDKLIEIALTDENTDVQIAALSVLPQYTTFTNDQQLRLIALLRVTNNDRLLRESMRTLSKMKMEGITTEIGNILLTTTNAEIKEAGAYALSTLHDTTQSEWIVKILVDRLGQDTSSKVREAAAFALGGYPGKTSENQLIEWVKSKKTEDAVRITAIYSLGQMKSKNAVSHLLRLIENENQQVRLAAVEALGEIGDDQALDKLGMLVKDDNYYVREAAQKSVTQIISNQEKEKKINYIRQNLSDSLSIVKIDALYSAGALGDPVITPYMISLLDDKDYAVRETAVKVLSKFDDPITLNNINDTLLSNRTIDKSLLRAQAARILGNIGNVNYVSSLVRATKDKSSVVRSAASIALGKINVPAVIDPLITATLDDDFDVRKAAAEGLAMQCMFRAKTNTDEVHALAEKTYTALIRNLGESDSWTTWFDLLSTYQDNNESGISMQVISKAHQEKGPSPVYLYLQHGDAFQCVLKNNSKEEVFISLIDLSSNGKMNVVQSAYVAAHDSLVYSLKAFVPKGSDKGMDVFKMFITPTRIDFQQLLNVQLKNDARQYYAKEYLRFAELITTSLENIYKGSPNNWKTLEAYLEVTPKLFSENAKEAK